MGGGDQEKGGEGGKGERNGMRWERFQVAVKGKEEGEDEEEEKYEDEGKDEEEG